MTSHPIRRGVSAAFAGRRVVTQLIVALDIEPGLDARVLVGKLVSEAGVQWFKVGVPMLLHANEGARTADFIRWLGASMMLDLKLYDTRDTVRRAIDAAVVMGAGMLTVHALCMPYIGTEDRLRILAVQRLTDGTAGDDPVAWETRAPGFICPFNHLAAYRKLTDKIIVCPGIRPVNVGADNHVSRATPRQARDAGADYIVVGRPIVNAADPIAAARKILAEIEP